MVLLEETKINENLLMDLGQTESRTSSGSRSTMYAHCMHYDEEIITHTLPCSLPTAKRLALEFAQWPILTYSAEGGITVDCADRVQLAVLLTCPRRRTPNCFPGLAITLRDR